MMKAVRFTIFAGLMLLLLMLAGCLGTDVQTSSSGDGDEFQDGDGDDSGNCEDDKEGDENSQNSKDEFTPPLLTDPDLLEAVFGDSMHSVNIDFGDYYEGWFEEINTYIPYTFDALPGAAITAGLTAEDDFVSPVLVLYGPRNSNGLWGKALVWAQGDQNNPGANILDYQLLQEGQYLLLVSTMEREGVGRFFISLGCHDQCREAACPDNTCQGFCAEGYLPDGNGCTSCECRSSSARCSTDSDCPDGSYCEEGLCIGSSIGGCASDADCPEEFYCDEKGECIFSGSDPDGDSAEGGCGCTEYYDPVCGIDGNNYTNDCLADCYGVEIASYGPCFQDGTTPCSYDNDCPVNMVCIDYICQSATDCGCPEYYDPVCGIDGLTYNNYCELECAGVEEAYYGVCEGGWQNGECQPICTRDAESMSEVWQDPCTNYSVPVDESSCAECEALCLYIDTEEEGWYSSCDMSLIMNADCLPPCGCDDSWEPVCGSDGATYSNACEAGCLGAEVSYEGECDPLLTGCLSSEDCPAGYTCIFETECPEGECPGYCVAIPDEQECVSDEECPEGMYCKTDCTDPTDETSCSSWCVYDNTGSNPCVVTGCNFEICSDRTQQSYCSWQNEYACLDFAVCEVDSNGSCGWQPYDGYVECLEALASASPCELDGDCGSGAYCDFNSMVCLESQCICPEVSDPVCDSEGNTHDNACYAVCAGTAPVNYGSCE